MEQQLDAFTMKRFELMVDMAAKKLQAEINSLKETICSQQGEINSLKSQLNRVQFQPSQSVQRTLVEDPKATAKKVEIVDCRPQEERKEEFVSGSSKNSEPIRPRYGDYKPDDVSIDKFFYFGRK
jgi:predicted RNase H-like nuclease (RuvC/YqgF family)